MDQLAKIRRQHWKGNDLKLVNWPNFWVIWKLSEMYRKSSTSSKSTAGEGGGGGGVGTRYRGLIQFSKEGGIISPERTRMQVGKAQAQEVKGHAAEV